MKFYLRLWETYKDILFGALRCKVGVDKWKEKDPKKHFWGCNEWG